ncbi:CHAP domain-containing protein [Spongiactinospora sp. TRM90649]|uniref:CHAP domain-containing protein n=1 Tax=Spongiactinospora sp. TRM90649 TaxID=3031114 RepID=UPI0023F83024|nr:CHAP domain-containing protein [Spongiactinospora sp. TRM90649]MDF5756675.1 CHAP domain-containing protein [Spongiactinospora sp. TRM90649]
MPSGPLDRLLTVARGELGRAERQDGWTRYGDWWADRHGKPDWWAKQPWCDMFLAWCADQVGLLADVGDFAYTPSHASWFRQRGRWGHTPKRGAVVFFDWAGSRNIAAIDHVGLVEAVRGETVITIEGNTANKVMRRARSQTTIAGFGYPAYVTATAPVAPPSRTEQIVKKLPTLHKGATGWDVKTVFYLLHARDHGLNDGIDDTQFGVPMEDAVRAFQRAVGLVVDGICGPKTWAALLRVQ